MSILKDIFSEQLIHALGWTLLHSLWQGALIALIIALLMIFLHRFSARFRYFLYSSSMLLFAGLAALTFILSYTSYSTGITAERSLNAPVYATIVYGQDEIGAGADAGLFAGGFFDRLTGYCHDHIPLFVGVWLLGMLLMMLRFLGGYALVRRYRSQRVKPVPGDWNKRFRELAARVRVSRNVRLMESALVKVPMAIGWLKPVVLLPLGVLNGVPAAQMEAILAHELAHIKRRDYLMNLMQSLLEAVFFYHPAVWWLSANIRTERENICDDIAINLTGNSMEFVKALTKIQEINLGSPALAAGLSGKNKNRLIRRIRRLTGKQKVRTGFAEGFIAALVLMISMAGLSSAAMFAGPPEIYSAGEPVILQEMDGGLPVSSMIFEAEKTPDTTKTAEKKEPKREIVNVSEPDKLSPEEIQRLEEVKIAIEMEMQAMQMQMQEVMNEYQQAMDEMEMAELHELAALEGLSELAELESLSELSAMADLADLADLAELEKLEAMAEIPLFDKVVWSNGDIVFPGYDISTKAKSIMKEELLADGLVDHGREYIVLIGKKQMHINGDKQSRSVFKKYRRLAESLQQPSMDNEEQEYRFFIVP